MPVIGFLSAARRPTGARIVAAFRRAEAKPAYIDDQNVAIECRWAEGQKASGYRDWRPIWWAQRVAGDHPGKQISLAALAAKRRLAPQFRLSLQYPRPTRWTLDLVASLNRPGSNITGATTLKRSELGPKRLELLHEVINPTASKSGLSRQPNPCPIPPPKGLTRDMQRKGLAPLGYSYHVLHANTTDHFDARLRGLVWRVKAGALVISN